MDDREELEALRRMAELEARSGAASTTSTPQAQAPGSEPLPSIGDYWKQRMSSGGENLAKGFMSGGPMGMAVAGGGEAMKTIGDIVDRGAYKAGGAVTDALAPYVPPEVAGGAGYTTNLVTQVAPVFLGGGVTKGIGENALKDTGRYLMQSALKPSKAELLSGKGKEAVETMLREGANVSESGVQKLQGKLASTNELIAEKLRGSNATISKEAVGERLRGTLAKFEKQANPEADIKAVEKSYAEFMRHPLLKEEIPVQTAQEIKQGTYKMLGNKAYGELKGSEIESQKAIARGLKEDIAAAVPEISGLNAEESKLINALTMARARALMEGNKNPIGIGWLAHHPESWAGFMADRSAAFKSALARLLHSGAGTITSTPGHAAVGAAEVLRNSGGSP